MDPQSLFDAIKGAASVELEGLELEFDGKDWKAKVVIARACFNFEAGEVKDVSGARALGALDRIEERREK